MDRNSNPTTWKWTADMMRQGSLFDITSSEPGTAVNVAGVMPAMRAAMNRIAGQDEEGRKLLVDKINSVAQIEAVPLTSGGGKSVHKSQVDKWLQPTERGHAPTLEAMICFCLVSGDSSVFKPLLDVLGLTAIPKEELRFLRIGKADESLRAAKAEYNKAKAGL